MAVTRDIVFSSSLYAEAAPMKYISQIVLAIVAVVGLVGGITFLKQYQVSPDDQPINRPTNAPEGQKLTEVKLNFPETKYAWKVPGDGQFEQRTSGKKDFWFQNDNAVPVKLGLKSKSCKCSEVLVAVVPPAEAKSYHSAANSSDSDPAIKLNPQPLEIDDSKGVTVEPGAGGVVRLAWEDKKERQPTARDERLVVEVWTQALEGGPKTVNRLELPVTFVPPLRIDKDAESLKDDLGLGDEKMVEFKCWSSTRPKFPLTARERSEDPCFTCSCTPLNDEERKQLEASTKSHVLCGYRVAVTVRERLSDKVQMELGPFVRRIDLTSDPDIEPTVVLVSGVVRGDVTVGNDEDRGRIVLGLFSAKYGVTKAVKLIAHRPGLELKVDKVEPESSRLKVKYLKKLQTVLPGGRAEWELCVQVPPDGPSGALEHTAVRLTISGNPPRQIRIPVAGGATR
jgi:hypothetical protein